MTAKINFILNIVSISIIFTLCVYHFLIYLGRLKDPLEIYNLFFSFFLLAIGFLVILVILRKKDYYLGKIEIIRFLIVVDTMLILASGIMFISKVFFIKNIFKRHIVSFIMIPIIILYTFFLRLLLDKPIKFNGKIITILILISFIQPTFIQFKEIVSKYKIFLKNKSLVTIYIGAFYLLITFFIKLGLFGFGYNVIFFSSFLDVGIVCYIFAYSLTLKFNQEYKDLREKKSDLEKAKNELIDLNKNLEQKVAERTKELNEEKNLKTQFFTNFTHETLTPTMNCVEWQKAAVRNYEKLVTKINREPAFKRYIKNIQSELDRVKTSLSVVLRNLLKLQKDKVNMLDTIKYENKNFIYNHNQISDVSYILNKQIELHKGSAGLKSLAFITNVQKDLLLKISPYALDRIFNNLIGNAVKYTGKKGEVHIDLYRKENNIVFQIKDTGIGIPGNNLEHIFDQYYQITHDKKNIQGIGLGLHIVKQIIDGINGKIRVESKEGKGTVFTVIFDFDEIDIKDIDKMEIQRNIEFLEPELIPGLKIEEKKYNEKLDSILIVEDNIDLLTALQNSMNNIFNTFFAGSGKEGLIKLEQMPEKPLLIISDIMMDEMDGLEFRDRIIKDKRYRHIPFIFLTAKTSDRDQTIGLIREPIAYVKKPVNIDLFSFSVKTIADNIKHLRNNNPGDKESGVPEIVKEKITYMEKQNIIFHKYKLSDNEEVALKYILGGLKQKEIADNMHVTVNTVKTYILRLKDRFMVKSIQELVDKINFEMQKL